MTADDLSGAQPTDLIHDRDTKLTGHFDEILKSSGIRVKELTPRSPNRNAFVERFIQTLQQKFLDHFVVRFVEIARQVAKSRAINLS